MNNPTRFIWIRHFPVARTDVFTGHSDVDAIVPPPRSVALDTVDAIWFASPLKRAGQTCAWLTNCKTMIAPQLMEQSFGDWEGKRYDDILIDGNNPQDLLPPGGETFTAVCQRVHAWIDQMLAEYEGRTIIAVCHAGVIRAALSHALAITPAAALRFNMKYASATTTRYLHDAGNFFGQVETLNIAL